MEILRILNLMDLENYIQILINYHMKENLKMVYVKEMEFFMEIIMKYIKENSKMVKFMDSEVFMKLINIIESIYIMKEILLKMRFMVKVSNFI